MRFRSKKAYIVFFGLQILVLLFLAPPLFSWMCTDLRDRCTPFPGTLFCPTHQILARTAYRSLFQYGLYSDCIKFPRPPICLEELYKDNIPESQVRKGARQPDVKTLSFSDDAGQHVLESTIDNSCAHIFNPKIDEEKSPAAMRYNKNPNLVYEGHDREYLEATRYYLTYLLKNIFKLGCDATIKDWIKMYKVAGWTSHFASDPATVLHTHAVCIKDNPSQISSSEKSHEGYIVIYNSK